MVRFLIEKLLPVIKENTFFTQYTNVRLHEIILLIVLVKLKTVCKLNKYNFFNVIDEVI